MWSTSCEILVASAKFLVALVTRKAQFPTLLSHTSYYCYLSIHVCFSYIQYVHAHFQ